MKNNIKRIISLLILFHMMMTTVVFAHEAVYLQVLIDTKNHKYVSNLLTDKPGWSKEGQHLEAKTGNFTNLKNSIDDPIAGIILDTNTLDTYKEREVTGLEESHELLKENGVDNGLIFTFPAKEEGWFGGKNNASNIDAERADEIGEKLIVNLNGLLSYVNDGASFENDEQLRLTSIYIRPNEDGIARVPADGGKIYKIQYAIRADDEVTLKDKEEKSKELNIGEKLDNEGINDTALFDYLPCSDIEGNLLAYAWIENDSNTIINPQSFVYAMPKGYIPINGKRVIENDYKYLQDESNYLDTAWTTIHQLSYQANFNFANRGFMAGKSGFESSQNWLEKTVYKLIAGIFYQLRSLLGLYDTEELVFNEGLRGTKLYNDGMMSQEWWVMVLRYHLIFQAIAWSLIVGAIVKILIQVNFSTINPSLRLSIMETLQKLFLVGFLLVTIIPLIQLMASLNNAVVEIFATQVDWSDSARVANHSGLIAGIFIEVIYFFISLYLNFVYIMRSLMIAVLVATGPFFVVTMAFSVKGKGLFDNWSKEMVANIFLQGFHAFAFAFILNVQGASRGIEEIAVAASLIPLTEFFRTMLFGQAGNFAVRQGRALQGSAVALGNGALRGSADFLDGKAKDKNKADDSKKGDNTSKSVASNERRNSSKLSKVLRSTANISDMANGLIDGDTTKLTNGTRNLVEDGLSLVDNSASRVKASFDIPDWNDKGILLTKTAQSEEESLVRPSEYLNNRGISLTPYGRNRNGKAKGITMQINNRSRLQKDDLANIEKIEQMKNDSSINQAQFKKENGIEDWIFDNDGQLNSISFNKIGMEKLQIQDVIKKDYPYMDKLYKDVLFEKRQDNLQEPVYTFTPTYNLPKEKNKDKEQKKAN